MIEVSDQPLISASVRSPYMDVNSTLPGKAPKFCPAMVNERPAVTAMVPPWTVTIGVGVGVGEALAASSRSVRIRNWMALTEIQARKTTRASPRRAGTSFASRMDFRT